MGLSSVIDKALEPFFPRTVLNRVRVRQALDVVRKYDAATTGRRASGWNRTGGSANAEIKGALTRLRNGSRELVRNNKHAETALKQLVANLVGDGIAVQIIHDDANFAAEVQKDLNRHFKSRLDGRNDAYGLQSQATRAMIEGGEGLLVWSPRGPVLNGRCRVVEGDFIDHHKNDERLASGGRIVQGVEFDKYGERVAFWLFDEHPGDMGFTSSSKRWDARNIDHVFDELRPGQARGVPWFSSILMPLRDSADFEDAVLMRKKIEACVAVILTGEGGSVAPDPFDTSEKAGSKTVGPELETVRPGMIWRARPGETASTLNPASTGEGVEFLKFILSGMFAGLVPYHLVSGDPSQANYSSLRAVMIAFWTLLDHWQQNILVPHLVEPMAKRRIEYLYLKTGDRRYLDIEYAYAMPQRRFVDPIKDVAGEVAEVRAGFKLHAKSLGERGLTLEEYAVARAKENKIFDDYGAIVETDPRRITDSGILQAAVGYIAPKNSSKPKE